MRYRKDFRTIHKDDVMDKFYYAQRLHQEGQLTEAERCYRQLIKKNPEHGESLHHLGILCAQRQDYHAALSYLTQATVQLPQCATLYNHLGNVRKKLQQYPAAIAAFQTALQLNPQFAEAYNNLGNIYFSTNDPTTAIHYYQQALAQAPHYPDACYNLGLAYLRAQEHSLALAAFNRLLMMTPLHVGAHYQLGMLHMTLQQPTHALTHFAQVLEINPNYREAHANSGLCYLQQQDYHNARIHYRAALDLDPNDNDAEYQLAIIAKEFNNLDLALQHYLAILARDPQHVAAHNNAAVCFLKKQLPTLALQHFKQAQDLGYTNPSIDYMITALSHTTIPDKAPDAYIKNLFDHYAHHFEQHLRNGLDYQVPELLFAVLQRLNGSRVYSSMADLGCGTGLCGSQFKAIVKYLVGVDLSTGMLAQARDKNIYDELIEADMVDYLKRSTRQFDVITVADVIVYLGDLQPLFQSIAQSLTRGGWCLLSSEIGTEQNYTLTASGRFSHHPDYLKTVALQNQLVVIASELHPTRLEYGAKIVGLITVLRRAE